jgi:hypothetical protein
MYTDENPTFKSLISEIKSICVKNYLTDDTQTIEKVFRDIISLFEGRKKGYHRCDTQYHNLAHTFQTIPPFVEIIDAWNGCGGNPPVSKEYFELGVMAVLLHDTGYIKTEGDRQGTGGKYTFIHIQRSVSFAGLYLPTIGLEEHRVRAVQNAIRCTGVVFDNKVSFDSEEEMIIGYSLGTADLLGQMSRNDYLKKLPMLYREFEESYGFEGREKLLGLGVRMFKDAEDLIKSTPYFFEAITMGRFRMMGSVYERLVGDSNNPRNPYIEAIEENIKRIRRAFPEAS